MSEILFLGTGSAGGVSGSGRSRRLESSALIRTSKGTILIDVTRHFRFQSQQIPRLEAILLTHAHADASGGMAQLRKWWLSKKIKPPRLYALPAVIRRVKRCFRLSQHLVFEPLTLWRPIRILGITIIAFPVEHSIQKGFPTVGYFIKFPRGRSLAYISDCGSWSRRAERLMKQADTLIIDGAMWGRTLKAHLDIKVSLPILCGWPPRRIFFTQIGRTAPAHKILEKEIKKICARARPAYDGLRVRII